MTQKQARARDKKMRELLAVCRQMNRTTDQVEKRYLVTHAQRLRAEIERFDGDVLFAVV